MDKGRVAILIAKAMGKPRPGEGESDEPDTVESEEEESVGDMAQDKASAEIIDAIESGDRKALKTALRAFVEAC